MGKAARAKRERREEAARPAAGGQRRADPKVLALLGGGIAVITAVIVVVLVVTSGSSKPSPTTTVAASNGASPALVQAAEAVGFSPPTEPGVGQIEDKPASAAGPATSTTLLAPGTTAPPFTLKTPEGKSYSLASEKGKTVLLEFFATWCPHCNAEATHLAAIAGSLPRKKYAVLTVNGDGEDAASVYAYDSYYGLPFPALLDPSSTPGSFHSHGAAGPVSTAYGEQAFPTFYVIDPQGKVSWASDGEQPDAKLRAELTRASAS